jgi:hypothetical protein
MEGETMRVMYEPWFVKYKVDVVYAGHVHAYERSVSANILRSYSTQFFYYNHILDFFPSSGSFKSLNKHFENP